MDVPLDTDGMKRRQVPGAIVGVVFGVVTYVWGGDDTWVLFHVFPVPGWALAGFLVLLSVGTLVRVWMILGGRVSERLRLTRRGVALPGGEVVVEWGQLRDVRVFDAPGQRNLQVFGERTRPYNVAGLYLGGDPDRVAELALFLRDHPDERAAVLGKGWPAR